MVKRRIPNSVVDLVSPADVARVVATFRAHHQASCRGLVLVYLDDQGAAGYIASHISTVDILGLLRLAEALVLDDRKESEDD
jgi:hypothetical protein